MDRIFKTAIFLILPFFLLSQGESKKTGFLFSVSPLYRMDGTLHVDYNVGIYTTVSTIKLFLKYGNEEYSYFQLGASGGISKKVRASFSFIMYHNAGFYIDVMPKHFGGSMEFYLRSNLSPFVEIRAVTLEPSISLGLKYSLPFID